MSTNSDVVKHVVTAALALVLVSAPLSAQAPAARTPDRAPSAPAGLPLPPAAPEELVIRGGMLIDGVSQQPRPNTGIVIRSGTLMEVGANLAGRDLSKATVIELRIDQYVLPGFIDMHAHFEVDMFGSRMDEVEINPIVYLANGITSLFDAGESDPEAVLWARRRIDTGKQIGPRIFNSGPRIGTPGQGADPKTVAEVNFLIDSLAARGAMSFKVKGISPPMLKAVIERAHMHGLTVTGHLDSGYRNSTNAKDAILMGIDRVEHVLGGDGFPSDKSVYETLPNFDPSTPAGQDIIALYKKHNVVFNPTQSANGYRPDTEIAALKYDELKIYSPYIQELRKLTPDRGRSEYSDNVRRGRLRSTKAFFDAGGTMTAGTDSPARPGYHAGFVYHSELASFVEAGVPPAAVLQIATINGARALNQGSKMGSIEPGKFADLVVINGNPAADIRNTRNVAVVVKAGVPYDPAALLKSVEGKLGPVGPQEVEKWGGRPLTQ